MRNRIGSTSEARQPNSCSLVVTVRTDSKSVKKYPYRTYVYTKPTEAQLQAYREFTHWVKLNGEKKIDHP